MVNISHQGNKNQNHNEIPQHTYKDSYDKKEKLTSVDDDVEKLELLHTAGGNSKWCSCFAKQSGSSFQRLNIELPYDPSISLLDIYLES